MGVRFVDYVAVGNDQSALRLRSPAPQETHNWLRRCGNDSDDGVRERFPAPTAMAASPAVLDRPDRVEEQNTTSRPRLERVPWPVLWQFSDDVPERRGCGDIVSRCRKGSSDGMWQGTGSGGPASRLHLNSGSRPGTIDAATRTDVRINE